VEMDGPLTKREWAASGQTKSEPSLSIFMERRGGRLKGMDASRKEVGTEEEEEEEEEEETCMILPERRKREGGGYLKEKGEKEKERMLRTATLRQL